MLTENRFIAVEYGRHPCLPQSLFSSTHHDLCVAPDSYQDVSDSSYRFCRLLEASSLLDKTLKILNSPATGEVLDIEALIQTVQEIVNLQSILSQEADENAASHIYMSGLSFCDT